MAIEYKEGLAAYAVGRRVNMEEWNTFTRTNSSAVNIGFGEPVMQSNVAHSCVPLDADNGRNVLGIAEASLVNPHPGDFYERYDSVGVCEVGVIGVKIGAAAVTVGLPARWDTVNKVWTAAAQSATVVTIPGAQFEASADANSVGAVRYRRPVPSISVSGA